jgi:hypothetical protein
MCARVIGKFKKIWGMGKTKVPATNYPVFVLIEKYTSVTLDVI